MTKKNNVVDLQEFRAQKQIKEQIEKLDNLHEQYIIHEEDPIIREGYERLMRLMKSIDKKIEEEETE